MRTTFTSSKSIDILGHATPDERESAAPVSDRGVMSDIVKTAARTIRVRRGKAGGLRMRRAGGLFPVNPTYPAGNGLIPGGRLVAERATGAVGSPGTPGESDGFGAVAAEAAREALSGDSAEFLRRARQVTGE